jgi:predicted RNase H-like HicB family nuclease
MRAELLIHIERADTERGVAWWAELPAVRGFYAAGDTLADLRDAVHEALDELGQDLDVIERLVPHDVQPDLVEHEDAPTLVFA